MVKLDRTGPTITDVRANPNPAAVNTPITLTASLADPGVGTSGVASASYTIDGGAPVPMSAQAGSAFNQPTVAVTASLAPFAAAGVHTICVSGADVAGNASAPGCLLLAVYDPSAGFVTGGGWIDSPAGACRLTAACQGAIGRANFGFVAKYQQGANVPTGQTEFQFQAGSFNFHSTDYQWLVISGAKAQYKGTINGAGSYTFMLTATDGSLPGGGGVDKFRIKITDSAGNVVYDNQMGASDTADPTTAIGGGNIIIHSS